MSSQFVLSRTDKTWLEDGTKMRTFYKRQIFDKEEDAECAIRETMLNLMAKVSETERKQFSVLFDNKKMSYVVLKNGVPFVPDNAALTWNKQTCEFLYDNFSKAVSFEISEMNENDVFEMEEDTLSDEDELERETIVVSLSDFYSEEDFESVVKEMKEKGYECFEVHFRAAIDRLSPC